MNMIIYKHPEQYTEEHNSYMVKMLRHYPGITITDETQSFIKVSIDKPAYEFINHMVNCDMIVAEE